MKKLVKACKELGYDVVDFETFKKIHQNDEKGRDLAIANMCRADFFPDGVVICFLNGHFVTAKYNGDIWKDAYKESDMQGRSRVNNIGGYNSNSSIYAEFIIGVAHCYANDIFPESFKNLVVNCMDGSANKYTAEKLGTEKNCKTSNLEWTTKSRNSKHGQLVKKLIKNNCKAYKFSSWDDDLLKAANKGDWFNIKMQLIMNEER